MKLNKLIPSDRFIQKDWLHMDPVPVFMVAEASPGVSILKKEAGSALVLAIRVGHHGRGTIMQFDPDAEVLKLD